MNPTRITSLTAADFMSVDAVTVSPRETLQDALALMAEHHVSGVPVVTARGRCVGVVSASDLLNYEQEHAESPAAAHEGVAGYFNDETQRWETLHSSTLAVEELADVPVEELMSRAVVWVAPETPLAEVARKMTAEEIHRVLVLDQERNLLGIVSAFDFVRACAGSVEP